VLAVPADAVARDLTALGPFFAIQTHRPDSLPHDPWHPMSELVEDPAVLIDRVRAVRAHLAAAGGQPTDAVELRVAASVTHLGLVARLISPTLGVAVADGLLLEVDLEGTRWQHVLGGAFPLSVSRNADGAGQRANHEVDSLAALLASRVLNGPIRDLVEATRPLSVSPRILWGNVASAINGAATMIATAQPAWADRAQTLAALLLDQPPLRGTSSDGFRRRSCCLIYRAAPNAAGPVCADCVLAGSPVE
jgi:FhuF-like iron-sulfur protein